MAQTQEQISRYLEVWKERLGLDKWVIALSFEDGPVRVNGEGAIMSCERGSHYDRAILHVSDFVITGYWPECIEQQLIIDDESEDEMCEQVIVHELFHVIMRDLVEAGDLIREE